MFTSSKRPPYGDGWLHEIKHDGFRCIARKDGKRVRLYSRPGNDLTKRFTRIVEAVARLKARTCIIDGEAVACGPDGIADLIRHWQNDERVFLRAFDLRLHFATTFPVRLALRTIRVRLLGLVSISSS